MPAEEEDLTAGSGGVYKKIIRPATDGGKLPPSGSEVSVHYEGFLLDGQKFDSSRDREEPFTFKLGVGQVIEGWDIALATMAPGEFSIFTCRADYAYGWEGKPPKIPVDATLRFEIELISWAPSTKPISDMSPSEKLAHGVEKRAVGTRLLKDGEHAQAATEFEAGAESLLAVHSMMLQGAPDPAKLAEVADALRSCLLNLSQCKLKLESWEEAVHTCSRVLAMPGESENVKARFRRGVALTSLERYDEAKEELKAACLLDPKSKDIREQYERTKAAHAAQKASERQAFGGMFEPCSAATGTSGGAGAGADWGGTGKPFAV